MARVFVSKYSGDNGRLAPPRVPADGVVESVLMPFARALKKVAFNVHPMTYDEYVKSRIHNKVIYERALQQLRRRGLREKDGHLKNFVKAEKLDLSAKPDPDPRIISPRSPAYNIVLGSFILPLEHIMYKLIAKIFNSPTVMKGMNAKEMGAAVAEKWHALANPIAIGFDVHRMDQHVSIPLLSWEHKCYKMFGMPRRVVRVLRHQLVNVGYGQTWDGCFGFTMDGRRASGDVNTGLGNCLIMCGAVYSALADAPYDYYLCNNGDDCVLFVDAENWPDASQRLREVLVKLSLPTEFEDPVWELEKVSFCQMHPVFDGAEWLMVRDPRTCLDKDACTIKPVPSRKAWNTLRASNSMCGLAAYGHLPVFKEFYRYVGRGAGHRMDRDTVEDGLKRISKGMKNAERPITSQARVSFFRAFDITPDEQRAVEGKFGELRPEWALPQRGPESVPEVGIGTLVGCYA